RPKTRAPMRTTVISAPLRHQLIAAEEAVAVVVHPREAVRQARHLLVHFHPAEPAVAVEVGGVVALVKALAHLRFALRTLAFVPGADLAAHQVAVAVAIDRFDMLEQRAAAPAARLPARLHFGPAQAAVAVGVQARMVAAVAMRVPAAVADHAAMAL